MKPYTFGCNVCGRVIENDICPFDDDNKRIYSTECCGEHMQRLMGEAKHWNINGGTYIRTKYSDSLAVSVAQIDEHKTTFPDIKVDSQGRPGFDTVKQHDDYLNQTGFVKATQKIRSKGVTI